MTSLAGARGDRAFRHRIDGWDSPVGRLENLGMAFASFTSIDEIAKKYGITFRREGFVVPMPGVSAGANYLEELDFTLREVPFQRSESFTCEALIYPTLREVWKSFRAALMLLSHEALAADADLRGEVDYVVCRRSPLGPLISDLPALLVGEAKKDETTAGWNQALGGMIAARKLDGDSDRSFFGLTTNGLTWAFGKLERSTFTIDPKVYSVRDSADLFGALHFVFAACRDQLLTSPSKTSTPA